MPDVEHPIGVLLMAYGGPDTLDDVEPYLLDIRGGRPTSPELVEEIRERYALIGGRSPLLDITRQQARALEAHLNRSGEARYQAYVGMRHWQPRIKEAVAHMSEDGVEQAVALVMAPHYSRMSTGAYYERLEEAIQELGARITFARVESWHDHPGFIAALANRVAAALERFSRAGSDGLPKVIFTAHSLPARILEWGDPYDTQLHETASLLAGRLGLPEDRWLFCYQSAGRSAEPWLGPQIEEVIVDLVRAGEKRLLVVPVGFVCDHVEILYDIDIEARQLAEAHGAWLERSESLNTSPGFIAALADIVKHQA
ncbi:MAG: ferrochelatase [Anaerolineae bacterium]